MNRVIRKWFWVWNYEKEEEWLNKMAAQGLELTGVGFARYAFREGTPGEYEYRLQLLENLPTHAESVQYLHFLEELGVEHVASMQRWVYLRKKAAEGSFELFSDLGSRIKQLRQIFILLAVTLVPTIWWCGFNLWFGLTLRMWGNLGCGVFLLAIAAMLGYGLVRIAKKIRRLKKEKAIQE